ncbi:MAG TPA: FAD-dependent oxidoreductase [Desulfomonilaceae bacterium]|nr:FAD-dependent oxidoreductase [Desulfomonilaceae bacterium]
MSFKEVTIAKVNDLKEGEMKSFKVGEEKKILLTKINGRFYALGALCPHYGASLDEGILSGSRIVCPWHHAAYDATTGNVEEPPSLDALARYEVRVEGEDLVVQVPELFEESRNPDMVKPDLKADKRTFVILGAGAAGNAAAQTLREDGFRGRIVMITHENRFPYDRPQLSKDYMEGKSDEGAVQLRPEEFYHDHGIELMFQRRVSAVDVVKKVITFESGETTEYDVLLIATGGVPRTLDVPGAHLGNIFTLRSFADAATIFKASENAQHTVVVGASFIGMETANALRERKIPVTVLAREAMPFEHVLGPDMGKMFQKLHEQNGVNFRFGVEIAEFEGDQKVETVVLKNGERIKSDMVILGVGVTPATDFLRNSGLLMSDGSLKVDEHFRVGPDVYAAGDIATFPEWRSGEDIRIEHWRTAEQQGRVAGHNMAGKETAYRGVPFFWTNQVGLYFRYVGHATQWDEIVFHGDLAALDFIAFFAKNSQVYAAAGNNREKEMDAIEELMRLNRMPSSDRLKDKSFDLVELLNQSHRRLRHAA